MRLILVLLVLAALLPGLAGSAAVLYLAYRNERAQLETNTVQTARALVQAVDAELIKAQVAAQALAISPHLAKKDFAAFHRQAREVIKATGVGSNCVLSDAAGQQLVNTVRNYPSPLPRHGNPEQLRRVFETGQPVISDVYIGGVLKRPVMSIDVPVTEGGKVAYDLSVGLFPERLVELLRTPRLPSDWVVAVFDTQGVVAARTHWPEKFVGRKAVPAVVQRITETAEGMVNTKTLEGVESMVVFSRSPATGWTVGIGIPVDVFEAPLQSRFLMLLAAVGVLVVAGVAVASLLANRIAGAIRALAEPALALGSGKPVAAPDTGLREAAEVAAALDTAGRLLARRTREVENANRELEDFSYAISHDLSTPLRAIAGYAQIVAEDHSDKLDADARDMLARTRAATARMARLIDSLVDFMDIARRRLHPQEVDMAALVRAVFDEQRAAWPQRSLRLDLGELPPAWGDAELLRRVVSNLIDNAIKFIPAQTEGVIAAAGERSDGEIIFHIKDNGVGFDMSYAEKLFQAFERLHPADKFSGLGIGLAVVKRIVGRHGGRVWAEGRVGGGAALYFTLPVRPASVG